MDAEIEKQVREFVSRIGEHVESVRVFVTFNNGNQETSGFSFGGGNFYAQRGQVEEWLVRQNEFVKQDASKDET